jgi:hypothetical protein
MAMSTHRCPVPLILYLVLPMLFYMLKISPTAAQVYTFGGGSSGDCRLGSWVSVNCNPKPWRTSC